MTVEQLHACDSPARVGLGSSAQYNSFPAIGPVALPQREDDDLRGKCRLRRQHERGRLAPDGSGTRSRGNDSEVLAVVVARVLAVVVARVLAVVVARVLAV